MTYLPLKIYVEQFKRRPWRTYFHCYVILYMKKTHYLIAIILLSFSCKKKDCFTPLVIYDLIFTDSDLNPVITEQNKGNLIIQPLDNELKPMNEFHPEWFSFYDEKLGQDIFCMQLTDLAYESAGKPESKFLLLWPGGNADTLLLDILYEKNANCITYSNIEHSINGSVLQKHPDFHEFYYFDLTD